MLIHRLVSFCRREEEEEESSVEEPVATHRKHDGAVPSRRRSSVPVRRCRCRLLGVVRRRAGTSREPPSSSTSAVDKVTARHYWGAADQGDVEAGEQEEAGEEEDEEGRQDGRQPEERWRV